MIRVKAYGNTYACIPDRWFVGGIVEHANNEEYFFHLRLPSYRFGWSFPRYDYCWQQLVLSFHGKRGFSFDWWDKN